MTAWNDLTADEQTALKRMNRGPYPALSQDMAARLILLGMAVERPTGVGISRAGRELVIDYLIGAPEN
ncbi:hypothetical protein [Rhizobium sp. Root482]|jgi:hypothetical protein|uniref:hypothetical protein n=1 Tax=Rhizobium sp. Root482 TaxID=1736543 RepID=UPI0006FE17E5|nr:hypothetical protein [Rhizobium sp. Root482]KQY13974.1 hypothetical protein ASD31_12460 [Rhizobium sp. Root482]